MNIDELIQELTAMRDKHGNVPVYDTDAHTIISVTAEAEEGAQRVYIEAEF